MGVQSPIARVRGLGPAREGVGHWTRQRLTAIANIAAGALVRVQRDGSGRRRLRGGAGLARRAAARRA